MILDGKCILITGAARGIGLAAARACLENGGEVLVATLISRQVDTVFFVPGGTYTTVLKAISNHTNELRAVATRLRGPASGVFKYLQSGLAQGYLFLMVVGTLAILGYLTW